MNKPGRNRSGRRALKTRAGRIGLFAVVCAVLTFTLSSRGAEGKKARAQGVQV